MKIRSILAMGVSSALIWAGAFSASAQWQTQSILVKPGWSAIYLHVDASYQPLDQLIQNDPNNPIQEVWLWKPTGSTVQFITSPEAPITVSSDWAAWERITTGLPSTLTALAPNAAYLVHSIATNNYTWNIKGKPVAPSYIWNTAGENLIGFPTVPVNPPTLSAFLAPAPGLKNASMNNIFQYNGGALAPSVNPSVAFAYLVTKPIRGQAFWIESPGYLNNYFGPFTAVIPATGVAYSNLVSQMSFHLQNTTASPITVTLQELPSETPPSGQTAIVGLPPLLVRGALNTTNLTYGYTALATTNAMTWTLPPQGTAGSDIVVDLGLNRYAMTAPPGSIYAGILKFTDSLGLTEVDAPVSAQVSDYTGLWGGSASVSQVGSYLKMFQMVNNTPVVGPDGAYVVTNINTSLGAVATPFPLRLILHNGGTNVNLLQRVFYGQDINTNTILALNESSLDPTQLRTARRMSVVHLPWSEVNHPFPMSGQLVPGGILTATVNFSYDDQSSNPFLHTYHPDHDNLNATFDSELPEGSESYGVQRVITLTIAAPGNDFNGLTQSDQNFSGIFQETMTLTGLGGATRSFNNAGTFALTRLSPIAVLNP